MDLCLWLPYIQTLEINEGKLNVKRDDSIKIHHHILSRYTTSCHYFPFNTVMQKREAIWRQEEQKQKNPDRPCYFNICSRDRHLWHNDWLVSQAKLTIGLKVSLQWIRTRQGTAQIEKQTERTLK